MTNNQLIYGCMGLGGGFNDNPITREDEILAENVINAALENGIELFDHADIYAFGKAEKVFGTILSRNQSLRNKMKIQSKAGIRIGSGPNGSNTYNLSRSYLIDQVNQILERLQTEYLDTFLLHRPDALMDASEIAASFDFLKSEGLVHKFGVSNMSIHQIQLLQKHCDMPLVTNQIQLSLGHSIALDIGVEINTQNAVHGSGLDGIIEYSQMHNMSLQTWGSLDGGKFTGNIADTHDESIASTSKLVAELAEKYDTNNNAIVLAWLMKIPGSIQPVIGTTNVDRICQSAAALQIDLSHEDWYNLWISARGKGLP